MTPPARPFTADDVWYWIPLHDQEVPTEGAEWFLADVPEIIAEWMHQESAVVVPFAWLKAWRQSLPSVEGIDETAIAGDPRDRLPFAFLHSDPKTPSMGLIRAPSLAAAWMMVPEVDGTVVIGLAEVDNVIADIDAAIEQQAIGCFLEDLRFEE